jgi:hypothetical protein
VNAESLRVLIRDVLAEELRRVRAERADRTSAPRPAVREEMVAIASDSDLAAFVTRLMAVTRDGSARAEIEQGRWVFRLGKPRTGERQGPVPSAAAPVARSARFDKGLVSEREVDALPEGTGAIKVAPGVRLTPLARDRARQRGIAIERVKS